MGLVCGCYDYGIEPGDWYYVPHGDQKRMRHYPRRKQCCSCKTLINTGDIVAEFYRVQMLCERTIDYRIHGEEKHLASWYECEECNDLRANLEELGYCVNLGLNVKELTKEYAEINT